MRTFTFNGITSDVYFLTLRIDRPLMPSIDFQTINVPGRHGAYPVKTTFAPLAISVEVAILRESWGELRSAIRQIASWLYTPEDRKLTFSDEPDKYYMARISGSTDLDELLASGETTLTFEISDPFAYAETEKNKLFQNYTSGEIFTNEGTVETFPRMRVVPTVDGLTYVKMTKGAESILVHGPFTLNQAFIIDCNSNVVYNEATGARMMNQVDISTDFFALEPGDNLMNAEPATGISFRVYWRERWI